MLLAKDICTGPRTCRSLVLILIHYCSKSAHIEKPLAHFSFTLFNFIIVWFMGFGIFKALLIRSLNVLSGWFSFNHSLTVFLSISDATTRVFSPSSSEILNPSGKSMLITYPLIPEREVFLIPLRVQCQVLYRLGCGLFPVLPFL